MDKLKELGVESWVRYVDDVFSTIKNKEDCENILNYLNQQHPNIKFTVEKEKNNKIPFLDTCVTRRASGFTTTIYHKPTFTGIYLNWTSMTSRKYKISLIYCLCDRIWKICKDPDSRELEFKKLRATLAKNEYPEQVIEKEITKFIKNRLDKEAPQEPAQSLEQDNQLPKQKRFIVLPYTNRKMDNFAQRLTTVVNSTFEQVDLKIAFKAPSEIGKLFPFKDNIRDKRLKSLVVYKIQYETCNQFYIGKTERILEHRIKEQNNSNKDSAIQTRKREQPTHKIDTENIEIIDKADNNFKLMVK